MSDAQSPQRQPRPVSAGRGVVLGMACAAGARAAEAVRMPLNAPSSRQPTPDEIRRGRERAARTAEEFGIAETEVQTIVATGQCPCGSPGAAPCWRMGGEAACATIR